MNLIRRPTLFVLPESSRKAPRLQAGDIRRANRQFYPPLDAKAELAGDGG